MPWMSPWWGAGVKGATIIRKSDSLPTELKVRIYLMIVKGQIAQKRPYWGEYRLKSQIKGKYKYLVVFWKLAAPVPMLLQVVSGYST